jgi:hypothetical protein
MKKMKLFCGILIGLMIFSSCSSDDDSNSNSNSIVGTWKGIKEVDVCSTGSEDIYDFDSCEQTGRLTFSENGTLNITEYDLINGNCELDYTRIGTWVIDNGNLSVTIAGDTDEVTFFEVSSNTLKLGQYDSDPNDPCDGGNLPSHYYTEFVRVE